MKNEAEVKIKKKSNFLDTQQEKAAESSHHLFQEYSNATMI